MPSEVVSFQIHQNSAKPCFGDFAGIVQLAYVGSRGFITEKCCEKYLLPHSVDVVKVAKNLKKIA